MTLESTASPRAGDEPYAHLRPTLVRYAELPPSHPERAVLRKELITGYLPVAQHLATRYRDRGVPIEDLNQVAAVGLINAVDRFDPARGGAFLAFAIPTIQGEIRRYFRDRTWSMRVPRGLKETHFRITQAAAPLTQQLGRAPRPSELAAHLGLSREEVLESLNAGAAYQAGSLDRRLEGADAGESLGATLGRFDPELERVEIHESLRPMLAALPARERAILVMRFFGNQTQSQIATRTGLSQMHISRLLSQSLAQLRARLPVDE
jgi:RNA polymerase sigma-B factor